MGVEAASREEVEMEKVFKFFLPDPSQPCEGDDEDHRRERAAEGGGGGRVVLGGGGGREEEEGGGQQLGGARDKQVMMMMMMMIVIGMEGVVNVLATAWWSRWVMLGNYPKMFSAESDFENWPCKEMV